MESITKNRQPAEKLRAMVSRAYGPHQLPADSGQWFSELSHGLFNAVYRIRLRSGKQVVLKVAPAPEVEVMTYERGTMATELTALQLIAEHTKVPVPAVHFADRTHELCDADYFFMSYVEADNLNAVRNKLTQAQIDAYDLALGSITRELNSLHGELFGPLTGPGETTWRATFLRMIEELLGDGERRDVDLGCAYDRIRAILSAHADSLDEVTEPHFVAWDLWPGNCMVRDGEIVAIVDHERAFYGDPLMEFGFAGHELSAFGDPAVFLSGYGHTSLRPGERVRRRLYNLHLLIVQIIETEYRQHQDTGQYDWAREHLRTAVHLFDEPIR
ncbi:phosphotransferase family protein [Actinoplanes derwentensis]|uniref:Predicted kinase, aminoglycoside phosphotransferase (APT) family n=1 Tax=Actinoplanes derwentensis TaxID=113562 RepID=A0A1H2DDB7_9ACTN|nr:aminoglycoside phosphotransferase family protein [Actinoplanes derwentensis]GID90139.1 aminoglycoside phosphotransferase [Actinoplanes derwentensis]SDT80733.1 Predicted kinase, aminoglycoside phosphotransferase (APT) family [Actinoplanes derwentensis]